ncbi:MAG: glycosyl transferase [Hungatella sp.]|nr:glycosyl transferase [Hungatella sp.]
MKIIAYYLPQFHETKQNNEWWGKGFTEWTNVKKSKPLYKGHYQPRVPLNQNYYDLLDDNVKKWQIKLAKEHGIYGFCFYHYWFNDGELLLEKPVEQFLENKSLDIHFCLSWANEPWTKAWVSKQDQILIGQNYGNKTVWKKHFEYLLPYFKDSRYICENNKPLFIIYRPEIIENLNEMLDYWDNLSQINGFSGMEYAYQGIWFDQIKNRDDSRFTYNIEYEPDYGKSRLSSKEKKMLVKLAKSIDELSFKVFNHKLSEFYLRRVRRLSYDDVWNAINSYIPSDHKRIAGAFVDWDNTPRRGLKGLVIEGASPEKFYVYFKERIKKVKQFYSSDMIFIFAWNEWAEGGYLEPDQRYKDKYLRAIKKALEELDEFRI